MKVYFFVFIRGLGEYVANLLNGSRALHYKNLLIRVLWVLEIIVVVLGVFGTVRANNIILHVYGNNKDYYTPLTPKPERFDVR